jgi:hypothetical protein
MAPPARYVHKAKATGYTGEKLGEARKHGYTNVRAVEPVSRAQKVFMATMTAAMATTNSAPHQQCVGDEKMTAQMQVHLQKRLHLKTDAKQSRGIGLDPNSVLYTP